MPGSQAGGQTFRCPVPRGLLTAGDHVLHVELNLSNQTRLRQRGPVDGGGEYRTLNQRRTRALAEGSGGTRFKTVSAAVVRPKAASASCVPRRRSAVTCAGVR